MFKHVVCFKLKEPTEANFLETKKILLSMDGKVELLRGLTVGVDTLHSNRSFDIILEVLLDKAEDLPLYQNHPYHAGVVKTHMGTVSEKSVTVDYMVD